MVHSLIFEEFAKIVKANPAKTAIFFKRDQKDLTLSYTELYNQAIKLGNLLTAKGVREQDKVVVLLGNQPEWPISFLAIQYVGAVAVPIDIKLNPQDMLTLILHSRSKVVICSHKLYPVIHKEKQELGDREILSVDSPDFFEKLTPPASEPMMKEEGAPREKIAAMFYTSGTTHSPKAVLLSQGNLLSNVSSIKKLQIIKPEDNFISLLPLHHTYSFTITCLLPLLEGAQISYPQGLNSNEVLSCMKENGVDILVGVPQLFALLQRSIKEKLKSLPFISRFILNALIEVSWKIRQLCGVNLSKIFLPTLHAAFGRNLRYMITGGASLDKKIANDFLKWGFTVLEGYGLTETSPVVAMNPAQRPKIGSVGKPIPGVEVKIVNADIRGVGEIAIKGPNVMLGYYGLPEETEKVLKGGWFFSGDLGYLDRDGYLYITGRRDEMLVLSSGKKVFPELIEKYYYQSPFIKEICIFASEQSGFLESTKQLIAVVVPNEDYFHKCGIVNIEEKLRWELDNLSHRLSDFQRISGLLITRDPLPRTALGKLMRHKVENVYSKRIVIPEKKGVDYSREEASILSQEGIQPLLTYLSGRLKKEVHLEDHIELDLGLDSLSRIELFLEMQKSFNIEIPESQGLEIFYASTVRDLIVKIKPYIAKGIKLPKADKSQWPQLLNQDLPTRTRGAIRLKPLFLDKVIAVISWGGLQLLFRIFFSLKIKGKANLPAEGPYIIYVNHCSFLDGFIVASCLPFKLATNTYFVGFSKYFLFPFLENLVKVFRLIPIDINLQLIEAMQACAYLLRNSKIICFFPEGKRSNDGEIQEFKKGIGILAKELNLPLVPVYIDGAFHSWSRHMKSPRPSPITVTFGKKVISRNLISEEAVRGDVYEDITRGLRKELLKLKDLA